MANIIKIKRSTSTAVPASIQEGELAYSEASNKLFFAVNAGSNATSIIGGKLYTDMLDQTAGTLTASSAILVDASSKIDNLLVDNLQLNGNTIQTTNSNGDLTINTNGTGDILFTAATMSTAAQATEFLVIDNSSTALVFKEAGNAYVSFDSTNGSEKVLFSKKAEFDGVVDIDGSIDLDGVSDFGGYATTNINIDSGAIDGTPIGANSASTGAFTTLSASSTATLSGNTTVGGTLGVTGVATFTTHAVFGDSDIIKLGDNSDLTLYHDGTNSYVTNATGALKLATETSGIAVTIGHSTSETTIADNATVAGNAAVTGTLGVTGATTVAAITGSGTATFNGNVVLGNASDDTQTTTGTTTHTGQYNIDNLRLDGNALTSTDTNGNISLSPNGSGTVDVGTSRITSVTDPSGAQDAATKAYVDAVKTGLDIKDSVVMATTADLNYTYSNGSSGVGATLTAAGNGVVTIDGIGTATANERVLVKNQDDAEENGIYYVSTVSGASATLVLTRTTDTDTASEFSSGSFTFVEKGTANADAGFVMTQDTAITFGTTEVTWAQFSGAGSFTDGNALTKTGNTLDWTPDGKTLEVSSDAARIKNISSTAVGDILVGVASNGGYTALAKPSSSATANPYILSMNTSGVAVWGSIIDGGTF
jgi:hypothetical protein